MKFIRAIWARYIRWCDSMGLTPENRRSCAPRLSDPKLKLTSIKSKVDQPLQSKETVTVSLKSYKDNQ
ncbi:hypothetical protein TUM4433_21460 [Shewanella schlegeliana]|nr:hypothetical protein [Shewanella schlegeliana]GIU30703.1 hypothetical protein TUM4433_21460 [Shewanella schlegeliana]